MILLGLAEVMVKRRTVAVGLVTAQALILVGFAISEANSIDRLIIAGALALRAFGLAFLYIYLIRRTHEVTPVIASIGPLSRAGIAISLSLALIWLFGSTTLVTPDTSKAVLVLVVFGVVTVITRRATLLQVLGIVLIENGLALSALVIPGGSSLFIEIGVTLDLILMSLVASAFHFRIFSEFGTANAGALRSLRD
jgi:hydrogenase-4 component E